MIDNVWYILDLDSPRRLGYSRGPDTPDTGDRHDWPAVGEDGFTVHWFRQNTSQAPDTTEQIAANMQSGAWRHFKNYTALGQPRSGVWLITDLPGFITEIREIADETSGAARTALLNWATFLETSEDIPRVGDPS